MIDDGYIKFRCKWTEEKLRPKHDIRLLNIWRKKLVANNWIGVYQNGIGFGNISQRKKDNTFIISGSATGGFAELSNDEYSLVSGFDFENNEVECRGMTRASSESLSHAVVYKTLPKTNFVFHIHDMILWSRWKNILPTTNRMVTYGTPEMAFEIERLIVQMNPRKGVFVMGGHIEGIVSYGNTASEAWDLLINPISSEII